MKSQLVEIQIMSVSDVSLQRIAFVCPNLRFLHIRRLPSWREGYLAQHNAVTAENSLHLLHNSAVQVLTLENCELSPCGLANIKQFEEIYLHNVYGSFTMQDVVMMAQRCSGLNTLSIDVPCSPFDWRLIRGVLDGCPKLRKLVLSDYRGHGKNTAGMKALTDMVIDFYPHVHDVQFDF